MTKRHRKFTLKDGTTVEYRRDGDTRSRIITSPCGAVCEDHALERPVFIGDIMRNQYGTVEKP